MKRYLLIFLLLCSLAWADPVQKYVDFTLGTDDAGHGGAVGAGAWKTLAYAESQVGDISGVADGWKINCSNGTDTSQVVITGDVTVVGSPLWINGDSTYTLSVTNATAMIIQEDFVRVSNLQIATPAIDGNGDDGIVVNSLGASNLIQIDHCTVVGSNDATLYQHGIYINNSNAVVQIWDCLVYNIGTVNNAAECGIRIGASTSAAIYNCTTSGGKDGIKGGAGTVNVKNCIAVGAGAGYSFNDVGATMSLYHCMGDDAFLTDVAFDAEADHDVESVGDFSFTATFRLVAGSNGIDDGMSLAADTPAVTDDIDGTARGATYDCGCDEYVSSGMNLFRRRAISW